MDCLNLLGISKSLLKYEFSVIFVCSFLYLISKLVGEIGFIVAEVFLDIDFSSDLTQKFNCQ